MLLAYDRRCFCAIVFPPDDRGYLAELSVAEGLLSRKSLYAMVDVAPVRVVPGEMNRPGICPHFRHISRCAELLGNADSRKVLVGRTPVACGMFQQREIGLC